MVEEIELKWAQSIVDKIFRKHGVTPEEVEEVIYEGKSLFKRGSGSKGNNRRYYVLGRTCAGRYLRVVLVKIRGITYKVITARNMEDDERRLYKKHIA